MAILKKTGISIAVCALFSVTPALAQEFTIGQILEFANSRSLCGAGTATNASRIPNSSQIGVTCSPAGTPPVANAATTPVPTAATGFVPAIGAVQLAGVGALAGIAIFAAGGGSSSTTTGTSSTN